MTIILIGYMVDVWRLNFGEVTSGVRVTILAPAAVIVAVLTVTPDASRHQVQWSTSGASACSTNRSGSAAITASVFTATGPGTGFEARLPVSHFNRSHRVIVADDTANVPATSSRGVPIATARTTRSRRSSEYAFMHQV